MVKLLLSHALVVTSVIAVSLAGHPGIARAALGDAVRTVTPTAATTVDGALVDPTCGIPGGTSLAVVQGSKLAGVDAIRFPVLLATSCLDNGEGPGNAANRARLNFLSVADGHVVKSISTSTVPSNGWAHLVLRPDKGDLLGCGIDGSLYAIDYSQFNTIADGTATVVPRPAGLLASCVGLAWDAEEHVIYQGLGGEGASIVALAVNLDGTVTQGATYTPTCAPSGLAVTGGALVVSCSGANTILRLDKRTGALLTTLSDIGTNFELSPDFADLACDPATFAAQFTDTLWSRNGTNGNGAVALKFPPFTCGLPSSATVLWPGLSAPGGDGPQPGVSPLAACFRNLTFGVNGFDGDVIDTDGDGLPDCFESRTVWPDALPGIDFDGDGLRDVTLCVQVDTNGDGVPNATECADPNHRDLFVEVNWMVNHRPDPLALSQSQSVQTAGVKSIREMFNAAPPTNPDGTQGIRIHLLVKDSAVTLNTLADAAGVAPTVREVSELVFTPCTPPAINPGGTLNVKSLADAADFDAIKKLNFGTAAERATPNGLNAKRLAFRFMLFAHNQTGANAAGSSASGCSELAGDDAAITLGSFTATSVGGLTHNRGTTDQQAGTFAHEFGHTLGLRHGGGDNTNCKPNYLSVMSYTRQIAGSPIPSRRLDYSRAQLPSLGLDELSLLETLGLCPQCDAATLATLNPITPFYPAADKTAFGPSVWSVATANASTINWSRDKTRTGVPIIETTPIQANINQGSGGCDGSQTVLPGYDDWSNILYRASASLDFIGGVHTANDAEHTSLTKEQVTELFLAADLDVDGNADGQDCGTLADGTPFVCTHRIDIKPSQDDGDGPDGVKSFHLGRDGTVTITIFSEVSPNGSSVIGNGLWSAPVQVITDPRACPASTPKCLPVFNVETLALPVKTNKNGQGTCSARDVDDPTTDRSDGFKDLVCQFATAGITRGQHEGVVSGYFTDPGTGAIRAFRARQDFIVR